MFCSLLFSKLQLLNGDPILYLLYFVRKICAKYPHKLMQKSPTSLCKKKRKHFRGVIGGRRCVGARAICNAFTTWILVGLSRVMTCFTTLFEFHSEERFLQSPGTFWVCIFHVLAWVKGWSAAIKQIKIFVGYWILSSN